MHSLTTKNPKHAPEWLVEGSTILLPYKVETWIPKNYRPIACLPTAFRNLASIITDRLYNHLEKQNIMTTEQRGGRKNCYGCKDQLMINNTILENCRKRKKKYQQPGLITSNREGASNTAEFPDNNDRHILHNKPYIVIKKKGTDMCLITDVAISSDYNIQKRATEKMTKYVDLQTECQRM